MSSNVVLESKQKLPQKVTDAICDISMMVNNSIATSNSNELMSSSFKAIVGVESNIENSHKLLTQLNSILGELEIGARPDGRLMQGVMKLSDAQESIDSLEEKMYRDRKDEKGVKMDEKTWRRKMEQEWKDSHAFCENEEDYEQMLKDRELLPENDEYRVDK